ncbi:Protein STU1 [Grifola frondosa]|uniref:Protein STU1 n=1 Tax=Grifola frondosa TaxID=5627 RepID=A0A1C7MJR0_GRIFR|nr:Protein STU1 [Grifola frondosa]
MANLTKKITAQQSQATLTTILSHTSAQPRLIIPLLWNAAQDKAVQPRLYALGHVRSYLEVHALRAKHAIESAGGVEILEKIIKKTLGDPNAGVRDSARQCFWAFEAVWQEKAAVILHSLDSTSRKQLEKACPNPDVIASLPAPSPPKAKKSSVAAAIAASRAKAKAIATAPPSLRHQATSTSHAVRATSPPMRRAASPSLSTSNSTGSVRAASPVSRTTSSQPRARVVSVPVTTAASVSPFPYSLFSFPSTAVFSACHFGIFAPWQQLGFPQGPGDGPPASPPNSVTTIAGSPTPRPQRTGQPVAVPTYRESLSIAGLPHMAGSEDESLLLATNIPVPEDSDSDMDVDESVNLISFSTPYEVYPPVVPRTASQANSFSPRSSGSKPALSNSLSVAASSPPAGIPQPIVEDVLRARAEQAESAAERLLELVEPEEEDVHPPPIPASLLLRHNEGTPKLKPKVLSPPRTPPRLLRRPPAYNGKSTSLFDMVDSRQSASEWWGKRMSLMKSATSPHEGGTTDHVRTVQDCTAALKDDTADVPVLKKLALLCMQNPVYEPLSPISPAFAAPLTPSSLYGSVRSLPSNARKGAEELEYGLIVLWEMLENQAPLLEGREADIFNVLLQIRYYGQMTVMQATNFFRDTLTTRIEPVYGLTTLHASLRAFKDAPIPASTSMETRNGTYAFGLIALGKFFLRLPAEVLEEELPRLRTTLISALTDNSAQSSLAVREAATAATIAAQMVLRDEIHLFTLLDGLPDDKKNLLTYLFDKHSSHGSVGAVSSSGMDKLEREMRRIDNRLSTPLRPIPRPAFVST